MDQFAFTTAEAGNYLACFWADGEDRGLVVKLNLDWKIGIAAKDWDSLAKKEKIEVKYMQMSNVVLYHYFIDFIPSVIVFISSTNIEFCNQGVELELLKLEIAVQSIHENLLLLRSKSVHFFLASSFSYPCT
jgi:hypothetical protein